MDELETAVVSVLMEKVGRRIRWCIRRRCWVVVGDAEHVEGEAHISGGFGVI